MAAYIVATTIITDPARFGEYVKAIAGLSEKFGGEAIVKGPVSELLEGEATPGERVVISRYPTEADAKAYIASPEYQAGKALRAGAGQVTVRLIVID
jgi:uncharacterized protein (DUF1330 family)